ncbi:MAG: fibronectin type 3 domain-containing protein [Acidimicrobiales bacterium]
MAALLLVAGLRSGEPAIAELAPAAEPTWGVTGLQASGSNDFEAEVWDFEQIGNVIYVAGKFTDAVSGPGGTSVARAGLASFNAGNGQLITTFEPDVRGGSVYALAASPDGSRLFVGGEFSSVAGAANTAGLAAVDPATGQLDETWRAGLERPWTTAAPVVRSLEVSGAHLYLAGNFSHIRSGPSFMQVTRAGRVSLAEGRPDADFRPSVSGGGVWDIALSPAGDRLYLAGFFTSVNANAEQGDRFAAVSTTDGQLIDGLAPFEANLDATGRQYAVAAVGDKVYVGGEEHMLYVLNASNLSRHKVYFTGSPSFVNSWPLSGGGDYQTLEVVGDRVYAGCHCWSYHLDPSTGPALFPTTNPPVGDWTPARSVVAYDAATGDLLPDVTFDLSGASGAWAILSDAAGCLWVGGGLTQSGGSWMSGFGKWCEEGQATDTTRPSEPKGLTLDHQTPDSIAIRWTGSSDNVGVERYDIFRSTTGDLGSRIGASTSPEFVDNGVADGFTYTYAVKAVDAAGNTSWRSNFLTAFPEQAVDTERPAPPKGLRITAEASDQVSISWSASTDNIGVVGYQIFRSPDGSVGPLLTTTTGTSYTDVVAVQQYTYVIKAVDAAGNVSWRSNVITTGSDTTDSERPSTPTGLTVELVNGQPVLSWNTSTDNIAVVGYTVYRSTDGTLGDAITSNEADVGTTFVDSGAAPNTIATFAVKAFDEAGNVSWRSNLFTIALP